MADELDKMLFALGDEADAQVDYDAMYRAIKQKQRSAKPAMHYARWGAVAACALVLAGVSLFALRGGAGKGFADMAAPAAEAPAPAAAEPQMAAYALDSAVTESAVEEAAPAEMEMMDAAAAEKDTAAGAVQGRAETTMANAPYARLINRENANTLTAADVPQSLMRVAGAGLPANVTLKRGKEMADETATSAFLAMMEAAQADGVEGFYLVSAYRSYEEQQTIWLNKLEENPDYGANGEPVASMPPGSSEHQTGLAFDITAVDNKAMRAAFADTPQGVWLRENCASFGFILRYPKDKEDITGVVYEPWHFRYVGEDMAKYLTENGLALEEMSNE
ncbi:MAG: M15 family metallopeptidase [Clostridia bacterium]|nr:M15 family metallopeptidase [Clostridia bacterium]